MRKLLLLSSSRTSICHQLRFAHTRAPNPPSKPSTRLPLRKVEPPKPKPQPQTPAYKPTTRISLPRDEAIPPPPPPSKLFDRIGRARKLPFILLSAATFITSFYVGSVYTSYRTYITSHDSSHASVPADVTDRWDRTAASFDRDVSAMETYTGLNLIRWWLIRRVSGHVLEASVGTGRNIAWYPASRCESITMVDQSLEMIKIAREKWREAHPRYLEKVVFRHQDVVDEVVRPKEAEGGFDYVVQTMGLCSSPRPVEMLRRLAGLAKADGRVLLLEHGRGYYGWLNNILDSGAGAHADKYGCWWNKDLGAILEESGVEVVRVRRFHFGTTWWIEVKPGREKEKEVEREQEVVEELKKTKAKGRWWNIWGEKE